MHEGGGNCVKCFKRGWNRKEGRANKNFKKGQAGSRGGSLKKGGWRPLTNYGWISSPGVLCSRPLDGSKVDSAFHLSEVDKMSARNLWEFSGKK